MVDEAAPLGGELVEVARLFVRVELIDGLAVAAGQFVAAGELRFVLGP